MKNSVIQEVDIDEIECRVRRFRPDNLVQGALRVEYEIRIGENSTERSDMKMEEIIMVLDEIIGEDRTVIMTENGQTNITLFHRDAGKSLKNFKERLKLEHR